MESIPPRHVTRLIPAPTRPISDVDLAQHTKTTEILSSTMSVTVSTSLSLKDSSSVSNNQPQLHTTQGDLKVELFCEAVPKTAEVRLTNRSSSPLPNPHL